jgi:hypothetical protein
LKGIEKNLRRNYNSFREHGGGDVLRLFVKKEEEEVSGTKGTLI